MKIRIRIGLKPPRLSGFGVREMGVTVEENYDESGQARVRIENTSHAIADCIRNGLGRLLCGKLSYVGYTIVWDTKTADRNGCGVAVVDFKEKSGCPPEILAYGRKLVRTLRTTNDGEEVSDGKVA